MTTETIKAGYVLTSDGAIMVQIPARNQWGFCLADDDQTWPGGFGVAHRWELLADDDPRIGDEDRDRLEWILADAR
jgi:hypothetical protein